MTVMPCPRGDFYDFPIKWNAPIVTPEWILASAKAGKLLPLPESAVSTSDDEG